MTTIQNISTVNILAIEIQCKIFVPIFVISRFDLFWCILGFLTIFSMPLVQFNTLSDTFLIKFLGKLLDEVTEEFGWLMYKTNGKM